MFDLGQFIADCEKARLESEPRRAIKEVIERAVADGDAVAAALEPNDAGFTLLHHTPELTVLHVVWAPGMDIYPHDHRMWAAIGLYAGREDNTFYRRVDAGLVESGTKRLDAGDVALLGDDTVHSVVNPSDRYAGAIHVYGGDFVNQPRSQWGPGAMTERPYDIRDAMQQFADANAAWKR